MAKKTVTDVSLPPPNASLIHLVTFINRQYRPMPCGMAIYQHRMGSVLLRLKAMIAPNRWTSFIRESFEFSPITARNWMILASEISVSRALRTTPTKLYAELGISRPPVGRPGRVQLCQPMAVLSLGDGGKAWRKAVRNVTRICRLNNVPVAYTR